MSERLKQAKIQTFSGRLISPLSLSPLDVNKEDICHALCNKCRFTGHTIQFYSVGQHSVYVSETAEKLGIALGLLKSEVVYIAEWGLWHDSDEFCLPDIPTPLKILPEFEFLRKFGKEITKVVMPVLGLGVDEPPIVKQADRILLVTEKRDVMSKLEFGYHSTATYSDEPLTKKIVALTPQKAKKLFINRMNKIENMKKSQ